MRKSLLILSCLTLGLNAATAADFNDFSKQIGDLKPHETATLNEADNKALFDQYCVGNASGTEIPAPNYSNELVVQAAQKLSETKSSSDFLLKEMAKKEMLSNIKQIKATVTKLATNTNTEIAELATKLLKELESATAEGFTADSQKLYEQLSVVYAKNIVEAAGVLATSLPQELTGVDYTVMTTVVNQLVANLEKELAQVDFAVLRSAIDKLVTQLQTEPSTVSVQAIKDAAAVLNNEFSKNADENSKYVVEAINELNEYLKANPAGGDLNKLTALASEINYAVSYVVDAKIEVTEAALKADKDLQIQIAYNNMLNVVKVAKELQTVLNEKKPETIVEDYNKIKSLTNNFGYTVDNVSDSLSTASVQLIEAYKVETKKFQSTNVLKVAKLVQEKLAKGEKDSAVQSASSLGYNLNQVKLLLGAESKDLQAKLAIQVAKQEAAEILTSVADLKKKADASKGKLTPELLEAAQNMAYSLESDLGLKPETKVFADSLVKMQNDLGYVAYVKEGLAASPEKKQSEHFYFYGGVTKLYGLNSTFVPTDAPQGTRPVAHIFLTQLCGEYRDRATMIEAKLKWATNIFILKTGQNKKFEIDINKNVWSQIPASAYYPYLEISGSVWSAKRKALPRFMTIGTNANIDTPVQGFTVCETKYIFSEYVGKEKEFDNFAAYSSGFESYKTGCSADDQSDFYDFRGDSNYKHYSPESNGMIWYATSLAKACQDSNNVKADQVGFTSEDCQNYFKRPFYYRYNAARAGLAAWLFRDAEYSDKFSEQGSMVAIYPHRAPQLLPFSFGFDHTSTTGDLFGFDAKWLELSQQWSQSDIGFNSYLGLGQENAQLESAYGRIRDAVDRHTDWYSSGFNDKNGTTKEQAYSPFVASSYEMSESDNFTSCGITVKCPNDGLKRWMFIFRIKSENWYTPERLKNNEPIDFDRMWFDETSFGVSNLADSEKAWDRLGTALENELDSVLYLINVDLGDDEEE